MFPSAAVWIRLPRIVSPSWRASCLPRSSPLAPARNATAATYDYESWFRPPRAYDTTAGHLRLGGVGTEFGVTGAELRDADGTVAGTRDLPGSARTCEKRSSERTAR